MALPLLAIAAGLAVISCRPAGAGAASHALADTREATPAIALTVIVPVAPYAYVIDRVGAGRVDAALLIPSGQSPHTYSPTPQQLTTLAAADILFQTDLALEEVLAERLIALNPTLHAVRLTGRTNGTRGSEPADDGHGHEGHAYAGGHGGHEHDASGHDPHAWLDPRELLDQAAVIANVLAALDPEGAFTYAAGLDSLARDIDDLDAELRNRLGPHAGDRFYVHHPAFGHFAAAYDLTQIAIEHEGKEPSARRLAGLVDQATADGVRIVLVQPQHASPAAATLAGEIRAKLVVVDPLAYDVPATLRKLAEAIVGSWETGTE